MNILILKKEKGFYGIPLLEKLDRLGGDGFKFLSESLKNNIKEHKNGPEAIKKFTDGLTEGVGQAITKAEGLAAGFSSLIEVMNTVKTIEENFIKDMRDGLSGSTNDTFKLAGSFVLLTAAAAGLDGMTAFGKLQLDIAGSTAKFDGLIKNAEKFLGINSQIAGLVGGSLEKILKASEASKQFENVTMEAAAKSGDLASFIPKGATGEEMAGALDKFTDQVQQSARKSALSMGMAYDVSVKQTLDVLGVLPGEIDKIYKGMSNTLDTAPVRAMELLQTVAKGTGQSFGDVLKVAGDMFSKWGTDAKGAAERIAMIGHASSELKIPFENMKGVLQTIDDGFKMWGNSAGGTLGVLKQVTEALKEQGLGYQAQIEITTTLANAMKSLSIEKKAFIGMEAGLGGRAIGAGLQVEQMIQKGDWGKVAGMMQQSLGNIGGAGKVVSLQEATQNPGQEAAFIAQRKAMESIFGIADTGMQNRLMDVMSKTALGTEMNADGTQALQEAFGKGQSIQEKQFNALENIYTKTVALVDIAASRKAYDVTQRVLGSRGEGGLNMDEREGRKYDAERSQGSNITDADRANTLAGSFSAKEEAKKIFDAGAKVIAETKNTIAALAKKGPEGDEQRHREVARLKQQEEDQKVLQKEYHNKEEEYNTLRQPQTTNRMASQSWAAKSTNKKGQHSGFLEAGMMNAIDEMSDKDFNYMNTNVMTDEFNKERGGYVPAEAMRGARQTQSPLTTRGMEVLGNQPQATSESKATLNIVIYDKDGNKLGTTQIDNILKTGQKTKSLELFKR